MISALEYATGKPVRLSRKEFREVKNRMELWQEKELGLEHSRVNHLKNKEAILQLDIERELNLRGKRSEKQKIQMKLIEVFGRARQEKVYYKELEKSGLELYSRGGEIVGVQGQNRRYRLKTLGFSPDRVSLEKTMEQDRLRELQKPKRDMERDQELER